MLYSDRQPDGKPQEKDPWKHSIYVRRLPRRPRASFQESSPEPFQSLDRLLDAVEETRQLKASPTSPAGPCRFRRSTRRSAYLHGFALVRLGSPEEAVKILVSLCGKLEQEATWDTLAVLLPRVLELAPTVESARSLAKLGETVGVDKVDPEALDRAYDLYPDEERLAYLMGEHAAAEGDREGRRLLGREPRWVRQPARYDRIEEIILKVAESARPEHQRHVLNLLHRLADQHQWNRLGSFLDLALPGLRNAGLVGDLWKMILHVFPKAPEEAGLRKWIRTLAPEAFPAAEGILDLLGRSGILDPQIRIESSIKQLGTLLDFAPGFHILHTSWGIGRVRLNDGDTLVLDFAETKNHRMKLTLARRALIVIASGRPAGGAGGRSRRAEAPHPGAALRDHRPGAPGCEGGGLDAGAPPHPDGPGDHPDVRLDLLLEGGACRAGERRSDRPLTGFRQVYRLRVEGDEADEQMTLPAIEPRRGIRPNLNLIRRFLDQHPDESARAARTYTPILERWARDEKTSAEDGLAVHLQLYRWRGEMREDFSRAVAGASAAGRNVLLLRSGGPGADGQGRGRIERRLEERLPLRPLVALGGDSRDRARADAPGSRGGAVLPERTPA